jgi:hypothetical protein
MSVLYYFPLYSLRYTRLCVLPCLPVLYVTGSTRCTLNCLLFIVSPICPSLPEYPRQSPLLSCLAFLQSVCPYFTCMTLNSCISLAPLHPPLSLNSCLSLAVSLPPVSQCLFVPGCLSLPCHSSLNACLSLLSLSGMPPVCQFLSVPGCLSLPPCPCEV